MGNLESGQPDTNSNPGLLGEYLKQRRLEKNFSLEKLSQKTKISVNILKSLEANDFAGLPSAAYIKGFVTSYAKVLGLPADEAIRKMEYTYLSLVGKPFPALNHTKLMNKPSSPASFISTPAATPENAPDAPSPQEVISSGDSMIKNTKSILPIAIFACIILLFIGGYKLVSSIIDGEVSGVKPKDHGPRIETSSALVKDKEPDPTPTPAKTEEVPAETLSTAAPSASSPTPAAPVATEEKEPAVEEPVVEKKPAPAIERNFPPITFSKARGNLFNVKADAPENNDSAILPEKIKSAMNPELQNVYIKATDGDTWMSYKVDDKPIESIIVSQGNDIFLQGSEIRMFLGNVNVTKIFYNNSLIETPNKSGVKSLIFPESNAAKYLLPLFPKAKDDIFYTAEEYLKRMKLEEEELGKEAQ